MGATGEGVAGEVTVLARLGLLPVLSGRRGGYMPLALAACAVLFALAAWGWVQFSRVAGSPAGLFTQTDFPAVVIASRLVASGQGSELYRFDPALPEQQRLVTQLEGQKRLVAEGYLSLSGSEAGELKYPYPYAPYIAVLWSPLSGLPPLAGMALWDLLNLAAFAVGLWLLLVSLPLPGTHRLVLLIAGLTSFPLIANLEQGQSSGLTLFALGLGLSLLRKEHDVPAGLALGLLVLKVQWLPFLLLVLLWKRRWRALLGVAITTLALSSITLLAMGTAWIPDYLNVLLRAQSGAREFLLDPMYSHSLTGGLVALLGPGAEQLARLANAAAMLLGALLVLYTWRGQWRPGTARWDGALALTLLISIFTDSHLNTHDLSLLVLPAALGLSFVLHSGASRQASLAWHCLIWAAYALPMFLLLTQPVRVTTLIIALMLAAIALLLFRRPRDLATDRV